MLAISTVFCYEKVFERLGGTKKVAVFDKVTVRRGTTIISHVISVQVDVED